MRTYQLFGPLIKFSKMLGTVSNDEGLFYWAPSHNLVLEKSILFFIFCHSIIYNSIHLA